MENLGSVAAANREIKTSCNFYKLVTYATPIKGGGGGGQTLLEPLSILE